MIRKASLFAALCAAGVLSLGCPSGGGQDGGTDAGVHVDSGQALPKDAGLYGNGTVNGAFGFDVQSAILQFTVNSLDGGVNEQLITTYITDMPGDVLCNFVGGGGGGGSTLPLDYHYIVLATANLDGGLKAGTYNFVPDTNLVAEMEYGIEVNGDPYFSGEAVDGGVTVTGTTLPTPVISPAYPFYKGGSLDFSINANLRDLDGDVAPFSGTFHAVGCSFFDITAGP